MRSCVIVGSGRSGTSMVAGVVASAGYFIGDELYAARDANPTGFYECGVINHVNEQVLARATTEHPRAPSSPLCPSRLSAPQRWLAHVPVDTRLSTSAAIDSRIAAFARKAPFSYKDPRFCYTLPVWRPHLPADTAFVCVFREPGRTANSILRECREQAYLHDLPIDYAGALEGWTLMYRHILDVHAHDGEWLFVHYEQALDGSAWPRVREHLQTELDESLVTATLKRSTDRGDLTGEAAELYARLCERAGYKAAPAEVTHA